MAQTYNPDDPLERWLFEWTARSMEPYGVKDKAVPPMVFTEEQSKTFGEVSTTVFGTMNEWFANFVVGNADVDADLGRLCPYGGAQHELLAHDPHRSAHRTADHRLPQPSGSLR